ncbi:MAG: hypothetical protein WB791_05130 [Waddliaceae bacterium]
MFGMEGDSNKNEDFQRKIQELSLLIEACDRREKELLEELRVTPEQLTAFVKDKANFTEKNWEELQEERQKWDSTLERDLQNILNPKQTKQAYAERDINPQWLYVK